MVYDFERMTRNHVIACMIFFFSELAMVISRAMMEYVNLEVVFSIGFEFVLFERRTHCDVVLCENVLALCSILPVFG
jgi:hypothetical protein